MQCLDPLAQPSPDENRNTKHTRSSFYTNLPMSEPIENGNSVHNQRRTKMKKTEDRLEFSTEQSKEIKEDAGKTATQL